MSELDAKNGENERPRSFPIDWRKNQTQRQPPWKDMEAAKGITKKRNFLSIFFQFFWGIFQKIWKKNFLVKLIQKIYFIFFLNIFIFFLIRNDLARAVWNFFKHLHQKFQNRCKICLSRGKCQSWCLEIVPRERLNLNTFWIIVYFLNSIPP